MENVGKVSYKTIKRRKKISRAEIVFNAFLYLILGLFAVVTVFPVISILLYSLMSLWEPAFTGSS